MQKLNALMKKLGMFMLVVVLATSASMALTGCEDDDLEDAAENVQDAADDAVEETGDALEEAGDEIEKATD